MMTGAPEIPWEAPDDSARLFSELHVEGIFYCRAHLKAPWGLEMPQVNNGVSFHLVTAGSAWVHVSGEEPARIDKGTFIIVPHGRGHVLSHSEKPGPTCKVETLPQTYLTSRYSTLEVNGPGPATSTICGILSFPGPLAPTLLRYLPTLVVVSADNAHGRSVRLNEVLTLLSDELSDSELGGHAVAARLADVAVTLAVRSWLADPDHQLGPLRALGDPFVGRVLATIHRDTERKFSVETLARIAGMSRSSFAARFTELVGEPPMEYVRHWRMAVAVELLRSGVTVARTAVRVGYASEAAFHRAFVRATGTRPGAIRSIG